MLADLFFGTSGPRNPQVLLVGESWGYEESLARVPFVGSSGKELRRMLREANLDEAQILFTNVFSAKPPDNEAFHFFNAVSPLLPTLRGLHPTDFAAESVKRLEQLIAAVRPRLVIACGNYALWALTKCTSFSVTADTLGRRVPTGIESWRGSMWYCDALEGELAKTKLLPIIHPAAIMREWSKRTVTVHDLRIRAHMALRDDWRPKSAPHVIATPSFQQAYSRLTTWLRRADSAPLRLAHDMENARGVQTCCVFAEGPYDETGFALVIPYVKLTEDKGFESYWIDTEEQQIVQLMRKLLSHKNVLIEGQNYLYDTQWCQLEHAVTPHLDFDTMLAQHLLFPGTPKGLDYLSSLYCKYHWYWKEDTKEWNLRGNYLEHLRYNAEDGLRTYECAITLRSLIQKIGLEKLWENEKAKNALALRMMNKGVRIDASRRAHLALELAAASDDMGRWFESIIPQCIVKDDGKTPWWRSGPQQREFFAFDLGLRLPTNRKTGRPTFGKEALKTLSERHPEFIRLFDALGRFRSLEVFHKTFVKAPLDPDGRMRCMFNVAGTETFRWSSSENAFGRGTNLQNIPSGEEE